MSVAVRVIPCLDVDAGRVVKGVNFRELRDAGDPVEMARVYDAEGADELTFLDVTASSGERATMLDVVRRTAEQVFIPLTVGGGIRSADDVDTLLREVTKITAAPVVASGGIAQIADLTALAQAAVDGSNIEGAIVGKALYAGRFTLPEALAAVRAVATTSRTAG